MEIETAVRVKNNDSRNDLKAEITLLKQIISDCALAVGAIAAPECSNEFKQLLPAEIKAVVDQQAAEIARLSALVPRWISVSERPKAEHCGTTLLVLCKNPEYEKSPEWEQPFFVDVDSYDGSDFGICAEVVAYMLAPEAIPPSPAPVDAGKEQKV